MSEPFGDFEKVGFFGVSAGRRSAALYYSVALFGPSIKLPPRGADYTETFISAVASSDPAASTVPVTKPLLSEEAWLVSFI